MTSTVRECSGLHVRLKGFRVFTPSSHENQVLVQAAPKVYEEGPDLEVLRSMVHGFAEQYNTDFPANKVRWTWGGHPLNNLAGKHEKRWYHPTTILGGYTKTKQDYLTKKTFC